MDSTFVALVTLSGVFLSLYLMRRKERLRKEGGR